MSMSHHKPILLAEDPFTQDDISALCAWLQQKPTPRLTQGEQVRMFEEEFVSWLGKDYGVAVNSGSSALLLAYYTLITTKRLKNKRVICPAVAWSTTIAPAVQLGLEVILCEAAKDTWGLCPYHLESLVKEYNPGLVVGVDVLGVPFDRAAVMQLKDRYGFYLIEDCAGAHGSTFAGMKVGTFGELSCFSFHATHHFTTVEGGMVCTNDPSLNRVMRMLREHGWNASLSPEDKALIKQPEGDTFRDKFTFCFPGFNLRMTDLQAFIGNRQLERIESVVRKRAVNDVLYRTRLRQIISDEAVQSCAADNLISSIAVAFVTGKRDKVSRALTAEGIEHRPVGGGNMARQPFLADYPRLLNRGEIVQGMADIIHEQAIQVPNHLGIHVEEIDRVVGAVKKGLAG